MAFRSGLDDSIWDWLNESGKYARLQFANSRAKAVEGFQRYLWYLDWFLRATKAGVGMRYDFIVAGVGF